MRKLIFAYTIILFTLAACKKTEQLQGPTRLFRPVLKEALESNGNWIAATWQPIKGATSYTVELSRDTFRTVMVSKTIDTTYYLFENLKWEQLYQLRLKANAKDTADNSKFSDLGAIKTPRFPSILNIPSIAEISDNAVKVSWTNSGAAVTNVKILKASDSSVVRDVTLTSTDITNAYRIVSGLTGSTNYIIFLYSGTSVRGWANFTTTAALSGNLIDLRDITGRPSVLLDTLPVVPSGSIVLLKRGESYTISSTANLDKSITILSGTDLLNPNQAVISLPNNFNITSGSTIDSIIFKDVKLVGTDYASKYVFNINTACNIGKISFDACRIEIMRGVLRTQSQPAIIGTYSINNCIIDSIAGYGIITVDVATSKVSNISIQNSTLYRIEKFITSTKQTAGSLSVLVSGCTFNQAITGSNTYIDYGSTNVTNGVTVSDCIFGVGKAGSTTLRDIKTGAGTTVNASNNYRTSDYVTSGTNDLPNIIIYTKPSTQIWQDPVNGDFKIIDNAFPGRSNAGDPRWRQ
jgi:hypothetical protein